MCITVDHRGDPFPSTERTWIADRLGQGSFGEVHARFHGEAGDRRVALGGYQVRGWERCSGAGVGGGFAEEAPRGASGDGVRDPTYCGRLS